MKRTPRLPTYACVAALLFAAMSRSQDNSSPSAATLSTPLAASGTSTVPRLIKFGGFINPQLAQGPQNGTAEAVASRIVGMMFSLYELQEGGSPLWSESQQVHLDAQGRYAVLLGVTEPEGLPLDLFTSGKALWLGVQPQLPGAAEQPRLLLVAVPYALKAADADTLGGKPASAYVTGESSAAPDPAVPVEGHGTANFIPIWTNRKTLGNSILFQAGADVGVGTLSPESTLDVNGNANATSFSGDGSKVTNVNAAKLGGLFPAAFQLAGSYAVTTGSNTFGGTQIISSGDLSITHGNLDLPQTTGSAVGAITLGGVPFAHSFGNNHNTFLGAYAGNFSMTGYGYNTAAGAYALNSDTTGSYNTTEGMYTLYQNTTGSSNTAAGYASLYSNTTASNNTAVGYGALQNNCQGVPTACPAGNNTALGMNAGVTANSANANVTGAHNTFIGYNAGPGTSTQLNNATAIGANALVSASNALVLGGTGANAVNVGIGTTSPITTLQIDENNAQNADSLLIGNNSTKGLALFDTGLGVDIKSFGVPLYINFPGQQFTILNALNSPTGYVGVGTSTPAHALDVAGDINASGSFIGDGSRLTNVTATTTNALTLNGLPATAFQLAGSYAVTNGANTFAGTQTISTGNLSVTFGDVSLGGGDLDLPQTSGMGTGGVINLGGTYFAHGFGQHNTFLGPSAGNFTMTGTDNTGLGFGALFSNSTAENNTAIGSGALQNNCLGVPTACLGRNNTAVGTNAGVTAYGQNANITGANNTFIGYNSGPGTPNQLNNATAIGANALVSTSNALVLGAPGTTVSIGTASPSVVSAGLQIDENDAGNADTLLIGNYTRGMALFDTGTGVDIKSIGVPLNINFLGEQYTVFNAPAASTGYVGIGTNAPDMLLTVNGNADKPGGGFWATPSDARLKTVGHRFRAGLPEVLKLNPVYYRYKEENALGIADHAQHIGLVAQEVEKVIPDAVSTDAQGYLLVSNDPILWAMLNAIKQQQALIQKQADEIKEQQSQIAQLASQVTVIQASLNGSIATARAARDEGLRLGK
jgi:hypothetical protein